MFIFRNGQAIELTREEMRRAYDELDREYKAEDIQRIIFHLNNLSFKGIDQASAVVDMINILNGGKLVDIE